MILLSLLPLPIVACWSIWFADTKLSDIVTRRTAWVEASEAIRVAYISHHEQVVSQGPLVAHRAALDAAVTNLHILDTAFSPLNPQAMPATQRTR